MNLFIKEKHTRRYRKQTYDYQSTDGIGSEGSVAGVSKIKRSKDYLMGHQKAQLQRWLLLLFSH